MASSTYHPENALSGIAPPLSEGETLRVSPTLYDVFINHRGPDVKDTLAHNLYKFFETRDIRAFLDKDEIVGGDSIPATIDNAISSASVHIAIFSKTYAASPWCLGELVLMLASEKKIIPVFYEVKPSDLRYIEKGSYAKAFTTHETKGRYNDKLESWRNALEVVSWKHGFEFDKYNGDQYMLFEHIKKLVDQEIGKRKPLFVAKNPVGLDELVEEFEKHWSQEKKSAEELKIVGIWGMPGCGKTTLAAELFNRKRGNGQYNSSCFLSGVAETESKLLSLQCKLLQDLVEHRKDREFSSVSDGLTDLKFHLQRARNRSFLIVLDDINHKKQLDALLVKDALGSGSSVIVTTRDEGVLISAKINIRYKLQKMDPKHSRELFCLYAFEQRNPNRGYEELVEEFVSVCGCLPLSLEVWGSKVFGRTEPDYWHSVLSEAREELHKDIEKKLQTSFDGLTHLEKKIFLDTACFFDDKPKSIATRIWEGSGWGQRLKVAFQTLKENCLVDEIQGCGDEFDEEKLTLKMHCHFRHLGRERAMDEDLKPRRLWRPEDLDIYLESKEFQHILACASARKFRFFHAFDFCRNSKITCFNSGTPKDTIGTSSAFIWLKLDLNGKTHTSIPREIPLQDAECLTIEHGHLKRLWYNDTQVPLKLKELLLYFVELGECTKSLEKLNNLEKLVLWRKDGVNGMNKNNALTNSLRKLSRLKSLVLKGTGLAGAVTFSNSRPESRMERLENIHMREEDDVRKVSISRDCCPHIKSLRLEIMKTLENINLSQVERLKFLELRFCTNLKEISGISDLRELVILNIHGCQKVEMESSIADLCCLEKISIDGCRMLQDINVYIFQL